MQVRFWGPPCPFMWTARGAESWSQGPSGCSAEKHLYPTYVGRGWLKVVFYPQRLCGHHVVRRDVGITPWHRFINNNLETKTRTF
ncbi:hypothetical protein CHARACLAT_001171 [Characodon lateralis]|uniref:Uncharacterized protein n=1 Tax=Characodon lateralis TaxID=208331 RepID=A0ABU7CKF4_9TELE|nr:hypothetical protein [Characodon lateralis]